MTGGITIPSWTRGTDWGVMTFSSDRTGDIHELGNQIGVSLYFVGCLPASIDRLMRRHRASPKLTPR